MDCGPDLENSLKTWYFVLSTRINLIILLSCLDWESSGLLLLSDQEDWLALQTLQRQLRRIKSFPSSHFLIFCSQSQYSFPL